MSRVLDVALAVVVLLALCIALGAVAVALDVASAASIPVLIASVLIGVAAAWTRKRWLRIMLAALAALLVAPLAAPELAGRAVQWGRAESDTSPRSFKVVTINVMDGNQHQDLVEAFLRAERPDVIILQEAREDIVARLDRALPEYRTRVSCRFFPYCGVVILSKWPGTPLESGYDIQNGLQGEGWREPRLRYSAVTLQVGRSAVDVAAVHILRHGQLTFDRAQLARVAEQARALPHQESAILAGDFNTAAPSHALAGFDRHINFRRETFMLPTWPVSSRGGAALIGIDHIYAGARLNLVRVCTGPRIGSDHLPVIAEFELD